MTKPFRGASCAVNATIALLAAFFPLAAQTTVTGTATLSSGQHLDLDTGTTGPSGGDLYWLASGQLGVSGSAILAAAPAGVTASNFSSITLAQLMTYNYNSAGTNTPVGAVFGVFTNQNNYAALLVTAVAPDNSTITLQYTTFHTPTISQVLNNYSQIGPGFPNSGIALGSLFLVKGGSLASATTVSTLESSAPPGLPTTLNGSSVSVTVNGTTVTPAFYYAIGTQLALVMPSNTPIGAGTLTVTYNGQTTAPVNIQVVASALGFAGYYGYSNGLGIATNPATGAFYNYTNSIPPGTTVVLWGSGLGADPTRDTTFVAPPGGFAINALTALYVGGVAAQIQYQGASGYPGVNQLNVAIPANVPTGCHVPVVGVTAAGVPTNFITLPIGSGVCQEPEWNRDGTALTSLAAQTKVNTGSIGLELPLDPSGNVGTSALYDYISLPLNFYSFTGAGFAAAPGVVSSGGCIANSGLYSSATNGLLPGTIFDSEQNTEIIPTAAGSETFLVGLGTLTPGASLTLQVESSSQVGAFTTTVSLPSPVLNWTNQSAANTITRSKGLLITWTGGDPGTYVYISVTAGAGFITCIAPVSANQFTIPPYVFAAMPPATIAPVLVGNQTAPQTFQAAQIDYGYVQGINFQSVIANLQ